MENEVKKIKCLCGNEVSEDVEFCPICGRYIL